MGEADRIKSEIGFSYKCTNSKGEVTLELKPATLIVSDQSPEAASGHIISIVAGVLSQAQAQVDKK